MHNIARKGRFQVFLFGAGRSIDMGRTLGLRTQPSSTSPWEQDRNALANDWNRVGADLAYALKKYRGKMDERKAG